MDIYDRLGVEKLINAAGNNTNIGGSLMAPEVFEAMMEAGRSFVDLVELSQKVGLEIARLARVEAAHVSSGAAGGVVLATAACLTGHSRRPSPSGAGGALSSGARRPWDSTRRRYASNSATASRASMSSSGIARSS